MISTGAMKRFVCIIIVALLCFCGRLFALAGSTGPGGSNAIAARALGYDGTGVNIGLISAGNPLDTHLAFGSRVENVDTLSGIEISSHDTWMAGIALSAGTATHPDDIGVAPGAYLYSAGVEYVNYIKYTLEQLVEPENSRQCRVIMTGIQWDSDGTGQDSYVLAYDYYAEEFNVIFANPAGNYSSPDFTIIKAPGEAYNGITVGGLNVTDPDEYLQVGSISLWGPTQDTRNKPDVVAPSEDQTMPTSTGIDNWYTFGGTTGATSFSTPHVAGIAALMLDMADDTPTLDDNQNVVIKAVIVNSTFSNINDKYGNPTTGRVFDNYRGYGRVDALNALRTLSAPQLVPGAPSGELTGWAFEKLKNYQGDTFYIALDENERLVITACWNRDIQKSGSSFYDEYAPKFNIDMTIKDPSGGTIYSETDTINNLIKTEILAQSTGTYQVVLKNTTWKTRDYGLAFEIIQPIPGDFEPINHIVNIEDISAFAENWLNPAPDDQFDLAGDQQVNFPDFAVIAGNWLTFNPEYYLPSGPQAPLAPDNPCTDQDPAAQPAPDPLLFLD